MIYLNQINFLKRVLNKLKNILISNLVNKNYKIAVIITGDVRDCSTKYLLKDIFKNYDVFAASYIKHKKYISKIGKNNYSKLIDPLTDIRLPSGVSKENMQGGMLQWMHLDNIILMFEKKLLEYDVILKFRFDYLIKDKNFLNKLYIQENTLFNDSDKIFYSDSETFIKTFKGFYNNLTDYTFKFDRDIKDDSLETSWRSEPSLKLHLEKIKVINCPLQFKKGIIDRGMYQKEFAIGNKRLYSEDNSFSSTKYWS